MANMIGNISYTEIKNKKNNIMKKDGIDRATFDTLIQKIKACGFENEDGKVTVYFDKEDSDIYDTIVLAQNVQSRNIKDDSMEKKLDDILAKLEDLKNWADKKIEDTDFLSIADSISNSIINVANNVEEYSSIIHDIKNSFEEIATNLNKETEAPEKNINKNIDEQLLISLEEIKKDIIRNIAQIRNDFNSPRLHYNFIIKLSVIVVTLSFLFAGVFFYALKLIEKGVIF